MGFLSGLSNLPSGLFLLALLNPSSPGAGFRCGRHSNHPILHVRPTPLSRIRLFLAHALVVVNRGLYSNIAASIRSPLSLLSRIGCNCQKPTVIISCLPSLSLIVRCGRSLPYHIRWSFSSSSSIPLNVHFGLLPPCRLCHRSPSMVISVRPFQSMKSSLWLLFLDRVGRLNVRFGLVLIVINLICSPSWLLLLTYTGCTNYLFGSIRPRSLFSCSQKGPSLFCCGHCFLPAIFLPRFCTSIAILSSPKGSKPIKPYVFFTSRLFLFMNNLRC